MRPLSSRAVRGMLWALLLGITFTQGACKPACPDTILPIEQILADYNANANLVPQLFARARINMTLLTEDGNSISWGSTLGPPNGRLLLGKVASDPLASNFVLEGLEAGRPLFNIGTSAEEGLYFVWFQVGQEGGAWAGRIQNAGAPGTERFFIDPIGLVSLLTLTPLPADLTQLPTVAMTLSTEPCAYVLTYIDRQPVTNRILFKREIYFEWSDSAPPRPFMVRFFAPDGRRVMTAQLRNYKPVPATGEAGTQAVMPTDILMTHEDLPGTPSRLRRLHIVLSDFSTSQGEPAEAARFTENLPPALRDRVVFIDQQAGSAK